MKARESVGIYEKLLKRFGPQYWWPAETPFEVMIGAVLTQNTAWTNVEKAISNLRKEDLIDPARLNRITVERLAGLIRPAGYFNVKAKRLKSLTGYLVKNYLGDIGVMRRKDMSKLRTELLGVHGVGPETCDSILLYSLGKPVFVIDAYTKRIFSRCGLVSAEVSYDGFQRLFMDSLPADTKLYNEYHALIVRLGKDICRKKPKCNICPINKLCEKRGLVF